MKKYIVAILLSLFCLSARGQDAQQSSSQDFIVLYGRVMDLASSSPLYYASVNLAGTSITNVTNSEGVFSLKIPADTPAESVLQISHLGFKTASVPLSLFEQSTARRPLVITLQSISLVIDPAIVHAVDPQALFAAAYYRIRENYPQTHVGMTAFYREMIRRASGKYLALNEAVVDIDKAPYSGFQSDRSAIYKGRGSLNYDKTDSLIINFQGGITTALDIDMVKNPFVGVTFDESLNAYHWTMDAPAVIDGKSFYVVAFDQKPYVEEILFHGRVYIESESLAIGRIEFSMNTEGREEEASQAIVIKKPAKTTFYITDTEYVINYREDRGQWYFDYCRMNLNFSTKRKGTLFRNNYSVTGEMAITNHSDTPVEIEQSERVRPRDILSEKVSDFADDNFWEDYNIIEPDQSIDNIIRKIVRQLERRQD